MNFGRRTFVKGIGAVGIAGAGLTLASGSASATSHVEINSSNVSATTNDGEVNEVGISPQFTVDWEGFDDPVGKVHFLVEAQDESGDWWPVFRATPWLTEESFDGNGNLVQAPGESGKLTVDLSPTAVRDEILSRGNDDPNIEGATIKLFDGQGRPDYANWNWSNAVASQQSYLEGNSIGSASQYEEGGNVVVGHGPQNNYPGMDAGYYGAADSTDVVNEETDGETGEVTVNLRYTIVLLGINNKTDGNGNVVGGSAQYTEYGNFSDTTTTRRELTTADWQGEQSTFVDHLNLTQDASGNSALVMNGEDGYPDLTDQPGAGSAASLHYPSLQTISANHPAVTVVNSSFTASVTNKTAATDGVSGDSNTTMN
ncbi:hypothetical protein [Halogeometricum limi]|uniref:Uncharacterized protein n=1 Tax=Halogeometricum limi TaxID=555875 RepID=A0A1I6IHW7_9EURY|nr:hypothetical protein [Halogeometricum limi]SFR66377.1 hypothetical protein SAMN04488124_3238 [Halogeometricum limi]